MSYGAGGISGARTTLARGAHARAGGAGGGLAAPQPGAHPQRAAAARGAPLHGRAPPPPRPLQPELRRGRRAVRFHAQLFRFNH